ncbi:hypothetical protein Tco_0371472 [Tanacetum coccineum]
MQDDFTRLMGLCNSNSRGSTSDNNVKRMFTESICSISEGTTASKILKIIDCSAICLDRHLSDHRPILLREVKLDFGPTPFRFYHSWFDYVGFDDMIKLSWHSFSHSDTNGMIRFKKKLQDLKKIIRSWIKAKKLEISGSKNEMISELGAIDKDMDRGVFDDDTVFRRFELKHKLLNVSEMESKDNFQKSKVKWAVEGDENSKFFHGIINKRRAQLAIRGIFVDGFWETEPVAPKSNGRFREKCVAR